MAASVAVALWISGFFEVFSANRGLLQLLIAIPVVVFLTGGFFALVRFITLGQALWGTALVEAIILIGTGVLGAGYRAWPWAVTISAAIVIPWVLGVVAGSAIGKRRGRGRGLTMNHGGLG